ncbi:caspase family protein [Bradyrhizobium liaoningense]|uniref:caspase family protein n=1 Tax=Bradyrhizobium liaoningense TaxID=43992 RepID=UPI001BA7641A|nr:caspase family protein [Bradyrhizobium liaoningense]MBR0820319.1 caspase family protein [Bradyrhizobium liaoningense]
MYIVLTTPVRTRFGGDGFFVLPPGITGPFQLDDAKDLTRLFIPLHVGKDTQEGQLTVRVFDVGTVELGLALIEIPKAKAASRILADFATKDATIVRGEPLKFNLRPGVPALSIRDHYSIDSPQRRLLSNSGEFELQDFGRHYRVLDRSTSALLVERDGHSPNFSPTSRFVAAYTRANHVVEIVDLYAGQLATQIGAGNRNGDYSTIFEVAWGANDAFVMAGMESYGLGEFAQTYIDRPSFPFDSGSLPDFTWYSTAFVVSLENAAFNYFRVRAPTREDRCFSLDSLASLLFAVEGGTVRLGLDSPEAEAKSDAAEARIAQIVSRNPNHVPVDRCEPKRIETGGNWDLLGRAKLSHSVDLGTFPLLKSRARGQDAVLVKHQQISDKREPDRSSAPLVVRGTEDRTVLMGGIPVSKGDATARISTLLKSYGISVEESRPGREFDFGLDVESEDEVRSRRLQEWKREFISASPAAEKILSDENCDFESTQLFLPNVVTVWRWDVRGRPIWLIYSHCTARNSGNAGLGTLSLLLPEESPRIRKLADLNEPRTLVAALFSDRYIAVSGPDRHAFFVDLTAPDKLTNFADIQGGDIIRKFAISTDHRWLLSVSENGMFAINATSGEQKRLLGRYVDDELVIYTQDGYYDSTREGDSFVYMKFPGLPGYYSLRQMRSALRRPDIIESLLKDDQFQTAPIRLISPPRLAAELLNRSSERVTLKVKAVADSSLSKVTIYRDGNTITQLDGVGPAVEQVVDVPILPNTRWLTLQAKDISGFESNLLTVQVEGTRSNGTLYAVSVGTDIYADHSISRLNFAVSDARKFLSATESAGRRYYRRVDAKPVLANAGTMRADVLRIVRSVVSEASSQDTVMLFFAGHGIRDAAGTFYLAASRTNLSDPAEESLSWKELSSALVGIRARVVVFIDACHSGAISEFVSNDASVDAFLQADVPLTIVAASKGRQFSKEGTDYGGGVFTSALTRLITDGARSTDLNSNGVVELSELYGALKRDVSSKTNGEQTPWIARNQMVGEIPLF